MKLKFVIKLFFGLSDLVRKLLGFDILFNILGI